MAKCLYPSSYECDCGHWSHFGFGTVRELEEKSRRRGKIQHLLDSEKDEHSVEFRGGRAVAVICPKLGRRDITGFV